MAKSGKGVAKLGSALVTVVQAADFPKCDHVTLGDAFDASRRWRVFRQSDIDPRRYGQELAMLDLKDSVALRRGDGWTLVSPRRTH